MPISPLKLITTIILYLLISCQQLLLVQSLFRHGARYPLKALQADTLQYFVNKQMQGQLTPQGKHMQYILGKIMYDRYWTKLFGKQTSGFHFSKLQVRSTHFKRTMQSAQAQLLGLLQNAQSDELDKIQLQRSLPNFVQAGKYHQTQESNLRFNVYGNKNKNFKQFPIFIQKFNDTNLPYNTNYKFAANPYDQGDFLNKYNDKNCPPQIQWKSQNYQSQDAVYIQQTKQMKNLMAQLKEAYQSQIQFGEIYDYVDNYICALKMGKSYLEMFQDQSIVRTVQYYMIFRIFFQFFYKPEQIKIGSNLLLKKTLNNMRNAINNTGYKMVLLSGHQTSLFALLISLGWYDFDCVKQNFLNQSTDNKNCLTQVPNFASSVILQLWQKQNNQYIVKLLYNGVYKQIPICSWKEQCTFTQFQSWIQNYTRDDPNVLCGINVPTDIKQSEHLNFNQNAYQSANIIKRHLTFVTLPTQN